MEHQLTKQQQKAFNMIESTQSNFLITGKPGTGKSVLTRALLSDGLKNYTVAAPTGLAALNAKGRTLHSIFRLPSSRGIIAPDYNLFTQDDKIRNAIKYGLKGPLIIDEISMVRADLFDFIDRLLQDIKGNQLPFGGIQVILVGDFYQLPPVVVDEENAQIRAHYQSPFVFDSRAFHGFKTIELTEVLRQKGDLKFIKLLDRARTGTVTTVDINLLNKNVAYSVNDVRIRLCGTNSQADEVNNEFTASLPGAPQYYYGTKYGDWPQIPFPETIVLKIGSQVMVKMNAADRNPNTERNGPFISRVVNGTLGVVTALDKDSATIDVDGDEIKIYRQEIQHKVKTQTDGSWGELVTASYNQLPLVPAWAISIHKSQGQSFDKVHIDMSKIFAPGQAYVALSRCRTLAGISFSCKLKEKNFYVNKRVIEFFNQTPETRGLKI